MEPLAAREITFTYEQVLGLLAAVGALTFFAWKFIFAAIVRKIRSHDNYAGLIAKMATKDELTTAITTFTGKLEESERRRNDQFELVDRRFEERLERMNTHFEQRNAISDQRFENRLGEIKKEIVENNAKESKQRHEESQWQQRLQTKVDTVVAQNGQQTNTLDKLEKTLHASTDKLEGKLDAQIERMGVRVASLEAARHDK